MAWTSLFSSAKQRSSEASGILFISSGGLGDTVLLSLVFDRMCAMAEPGEDITLVLPREAIKMAFLFDEKINILPVDYTAFRKSRTYKKEIFDRLYEANYRVVVSTDFLRHPKLDEALIKACAAPETLAMAPRSWPKYDKALTKNRALYSRLFESGPVHLDKVLRWARLANWLTGKGQYSIPAPLVRLPDGAVKAGPAYPRPTVILVPFSAVKEKQSPPDVFLAIMQHLEGRCDFVIASAPNDLEKNPEYMSLANRPNVSFETAFFEDLAPKLKQAQLVVSVDTACMHLAAAVGAPTICLASAAYVGEIVPYAPEITPDNVRFVYTPMACEGCLGNCILPAENNRFPCVARLDQTQILAAIDELLSI
jgi:ADP-heptose:LPS heptosyltransferase